MPGILYSGQATSKPPIFELFNSNDSRFLAGIDNLDASLTINSITVTPMFRYKGGDADGTDWNYWTYGSDLTLQSGTAPSYQQPTPLYGSNDISVKFNDGGYYLAGNTTTGDVGTEDMVLEIIFKLPADGTTRQLLGHKDTAASPASTGYSIWTSLSILRFAINDGSGDLATAPVTATLTPNSWYHAILFVDRSGSGVWYVNGVVQTAAAVSTKSNSLSASTEFVIGSTDTGSADYNSDILYCAGWKYAGWLDTHLQATIAAERFSKLAGHYGWRNVGSKTPVSMAIRAQANYLDRYIDSTTRQLFYVGSHWPKICHRKDSNSASLYGYVMESGRVNKCLESQTFATTWTKVNVGDTVTNNASTSPTGLTDASTLKADSTSTTHGVTQAITLTAAIHTFSVWAKAGNKSWLYLSNDTVANATAYFDLSNSALGTVGAGCTASIENWGNGWNRCWITYTGTVAPHTHKILTATADTTTTFAGDGSTVNTYLFGAQVENHQFATTYLPTTTSTVTRTIDSLSYDDTSNWDTTGSMVCKMLLPSHDNPVTISFLDVNNNGGTYSVGVWGVAVSDVAQFAVYNTLAQALISGTTDIFDGVIHTIAGSYKTDEFKLFVDGAQQSTTDTSGSMPTTGNMIRIYIGRNAGGTQTTNGLVGSCKIYNKTNRRS